MPKYNNRCRTYNSTHFRCLPNVFLIGASKSGTTSIVGHLARHPGVSFVRRRVDSHRHREIHRFDRSWYPWSWKQLELLDEWSLCPLVTHPDAIVVHYTPHYLYAPSVPFELRDLYSTASPHSDSNSNSNIDHFRFIVVLREPVSRAISSYWFKNSRLLMKHDTGSVKDFETKFEQEIVVRRKYEKCMVSRGHGVVPMTTSISISASSSPDNRPSNSTATSTISKYLTPLPSHDRASLLTSLRICFGGDASFRSPTLGLRHVDKGVYVDQFLRWRANFIHSQFLVQSLEQWSASPVGAMEELLAFLGLQLRGRDGIGVDDETALELLLSEKKLVTSNFRNESIPDDLRRRLTDFYRPYNAMLEKLLGQNFGYPT
eukprot:gene3462-6888_t